MGTYVPLTPVYNLQHYWCLLQAASSIGTECGVHSFQKELKIYLPTEQFSTSLWSILN